MDREALQQIGAADLSARSAEIVIDGQSLLIAHGHVHSVEPIGDVQMGTGEGPAVGTIALGEQRWQVYSLDGNLDKIAEVPRRRRACVLLKPDHGGVGFLCDEVHVVENEALTTVPVPGCMQGEDSLLDSLAVIEGKITCVLAADRLAAMLEPAEASDDPAAAAGDG